MHPIRSLIVRVLVAIGVAGVVVAGTAAASSGATATAPPPVQPPTAASSSVAATTTPPDEVVLGHLATSSRSRRAPRPGGVTTSPSGGGRTHPGIADDLKGGPGCSIQCIAGGVAYARGPAARLVVHTDGTPVFMRILVTGPDYFRSVDSADGVTSFGADFLDLESDTTYQGLVTAWDGSGYAAVRSGTFTTLQRDVVLEIDHAVLQDTPYGDDEIQARFWFDEVLQLEASGIDPEGDELPLGPIVVHDLDRDRYLDLALELVQGEEDPDDVCESPSNPDGPDAGHQDCTRWASAYPDDGPVDLDDRPGSADSWTEWVLHLDLVLPSPEGLPPGFGEALSFRVPVTLEVAYT